MGKLILLFTVVPVVEFYLLFHLARSFGFFTTLGLVIVTGVLGAALAKSEGVRLLQEWHEAMLQQRVPEEGVISGVLLLIGGVLLVTPGVLTDLTGLLLLLPSTRRLVATWVHRELERRVRSGDLYVHVENSDFRSADPFFSGEDLGRSAPFGEEIIEGSFEVVEGEYSDPSDPESKHVDS